MARKSSAKRTDAAPANERFEVNLNELAQITGKSLPTLRSLIDRNEDFPVGQRGTNGVAYSFDAAEVKAWFDRHDREVEDADEARRENVKQLRLELFGETATDEDRGLSAAERQKEIAAELEAVKLGRMRGELVRAADVAAMLAEAFGALRKDLEDLPPAVAKRLELDRGSQQAIRELVDAALTRCADRLARIAEDDRDVAAA